MLPDTKAVLVILLQVYHSLHTFNGVCQIYWDNNAICFEMHEVVVSIEVSIWFRMKELGLELNWAQFGLLIRFLERNLVLLGKVVLLSLQGGRLKDLKTRVLMVLFIFDTIFFIVLTFVMKNSSKANTIGLSLYFIKIWRKTQHQR